MSEPEDDPFTNKSPVNFKNQPKQANELAVKTTPDPLEIVWRQVSNYDAYLVQIQRCGNPPAAGSNQISPLSPMDFEALKIEYKSDDSSSVPNGQFTVHGVNSRESAETPTKLSLARISKSAFTDFISMLFCIAFLAGGVLADDLSNERNYLSSFYQRLKETRTELTDVGFALLIFLVIVVVFLVSLACIYRVKKHRQNRPLQNPMHSFINSIHYLVNELRLDETLNLVSQIRSNEDLMKRLVNTTLDKVINTAVWNNRSVTFNNGALNYLLQLTNDKNPNFIERHLFRAECRMRRRNYPRNLFFLQRRAIELVGQQLGERWI